MWGIRELKGKEDFVYFCIIISCVVRFLNKGGVWQTCVLLVNLILSNNRSEIRGIVSRLHSTISCG